MRSAPIARLLRDLLGDGAHNKRVPKEVLLNTDLAIVEAFLQGYQDGDGSVRGNIGQANTVSRTLALGLQLAMARLGRLMCVSEHVGKLGSIQGRALPRCRFYALRWRVQDLWHKKHKVLDDYIAVPVRQRRLVPYDGEVVDIETESHDFLVSNAVVHNSYNLQDTNLLVLLYLPYDPRRYKQVLGRIRRWNMREGLVPRVALILAKGTKDMAVKATVLDKFKSLVELVDAEDQEIVDRLTERDGSGGTVEEVMSRMAEKLVAGFKKQRASGAMSA